ncbi:extracellular solute-binding protein [Candidatus Aerophobetes bacterium]|nr:extracellular solute-binding protein [Candidatus Aerophobetes bacterium]
MRQKVSIWMVLILIGSLVLCSGISFAQKTITLNVAMEAGRMADAANSVVPAFEKAYPNTKVKVIPLPYTTLWQKLVQELSAGSGAYDVIEAHLILNAMFIKSGWIIPLDKYIKEGKIDVSDFLPAFWKIGTLAGKASQLNPKGKIYGLPYNGDIMMLIFRKDLYPLYGLTVPKTWEDFVKNVTTVNNPEKDFYGLAISGARAENSHVIYDFYNMALNMGGTLPLGKGYKPQMFSPGNLKALQLYADFVNKYKVTPPGVREYRYAEKNTALAQGKAAHMFQWMLACYKSLEDPTQSRVSGKIGYTTMPGGTSVAGGWTVSITNTCKYPKRAFDFINFLTNTENNKKLAIEFGNGPVRKSSAQAPEMAKKFPFISDYIKASINGVNVQFSAPELPIWPQLVDIINFRLTDTIFKGKPAEAMLKQADREMANLLKEQGFIK